MKNNKDLLLEKILFLMRYDLSKTSKENAILKEQPDSRFLDSDTKQILAKGEEQIKKDEELEKSNQELLNSCKYGCRYPEKAVCPSKNEAGMEGKDAMIAGYCFYPCASVGYEGVSGIFIENNADILFFNDSYIIKWVQSLINKFPETYSDKDYDYLYDNLTRIFKPGTVIQFKDSKSTWKNLIRYNSDIGYWESIGFYDENRNPYVQPKWVDVRTDYQKFVDEWGVWLQVGAAVVTAIAGGLTGGAAWVITAEIITEMGLGIMVGAREIEKGNNVSAVVSFATGVLPFFKLFPELKGISRAKFKSLQDKILTSGLGENPTQSEVKDFIETLKDPDENLIMKKMLMGDDASVAQMQNKLKSAGMTEFEEIYLSEFKEVLKTNPDLFKKIDFWDRLWVRELSANVIVGVVGIVINATLGYKLNDAEMEVLDGIYTVTPDGQKKDLIYSLGSQPEVAVKILQSQETKDSIKELATQKVEQSGDVYLKNFIEKQKKLFENNGGTYKGGIDQNTTPTDEEKYRKMGYIPVSEWPSDKEFDDQIKINGKFWVK